MSIAYQNLIAHLDGHEFKYMNDYERESVFLPINTEFATFNISARVREELFQVIGWASIKVPAGCRKDVAETIARANYGLHVGKFEMDFRDGELRFQAYTILENDNLSDELAGRLIKTVLAMLDRYIPAVMSVMFANEQPEEAIRRVEMPSFANHAAGGDDRVGESDS